VVVYMFNHSDAPQILTVQEPLCHLLEPRQAGATIFPETEIKFDPHSGGNIKLKLQCAEPWAGGEDGKVQIVGATRSGQEIDKSVKARIEPALRWFA